MSETIIWFLVWGALILVMMRFGCGGHVMGHQHGGRHHHDTANTPTGVGQPEEAIDPVCGMTVRTREAKSSFFKGRAWFFCSSDCRQKFEADPGKYADGGATRMEGHHHG